MQHTDEQLSTLLGHWFEPLIGDDSVEEELDDLCSLLDYRVKSWGALTHYATYAAWWEVEGYLAPDGMFVCADVAALRQRVLGRPIEQFGLVVELTYRARSVTAELDGETRLPPGHALLRELVAWQEDAAHGSESAQRKAQPYLQRHRETKAHRRMREREIVAQARQRGYLVVHPSTTRWVKDAFRHRCK